MKPDAQEQETQWWVIGTDFVLAIDRIENRELIRSEYTVTGACVRRITDALTGDGVPAFLEIASATGGRYLIPTGAIQIVSINPA